LPAKAALRLGGIPLQQIDLSRPKELGIDYDMSFVVEPDMGKRDPAHLPHGGCASGRHNVIVGGILLQLELHRCTVVADESPVASGVDVAQPQFLLLAELDARYGIGHFTSDE